MSEECWINQFQTEAKHTICGPACSAPEEAEHQAAWALKTYPWRRLYRIHVIPKPQNRP